MRSYLLPLLASLIAAAATAGLATAGKDDDDDRGGDRSARSYEVGLWGDLPYSEEQRTVGVPNLVADMNRQRLALTVHDGDIKSGASPCSNDVYAQAETYFNALEAPSLYTPGDNEWTDCDRQPGVSSRERLEYIRNTLFDNQTSFGQRRIRLESQAPPRQKFTENRRTVIGRVVHATLHVVGSNNNLGDVAPDPEEYAERDQATNQWLRQSFDEAKRVNASGIMLYTQANPGFDRADPTRSPSRDPRTLAGGPDGNGFDNFLRELRQQTREFRRPVVLVIGDSHYLRVDKPLQDEKGRRLENFTRVETPGDNPQNGNNEVQWVKVLVEPKSREVFSFQPQVVPANRVAVPAP